MFTGLETLEQWFLIFESDPFKNLMKIIGLSSGKFRSTKLCIDFQWIYGTP